MATAAAILLITIVAGVWFTSVGMFGGAPDSIAYEGAASNIAAGRGLTTPFALMTERASPEQQLAWGDALPLTEQPPGYPLALAAMHGIGLSGESAAHVLSIAGLALLAAGVAIAAAVGLGRRPLPVAAITLLAVLGPSSTEFKGVMGGPLPMAPSILSERLALPLSIVALALVAVPLPRVRSLSPETVDRIRLALVAAVIVASTLTRFTGAACGVACAVAVAMDSRRTRRSRAIWGSTLLVIGPVTILVISTIVGGAPKAIAWHPRSVFGPMIDVMSDWFLLSRSLPFALRVAALALLVIGPIVLAFTRRATEPDRRSIAVALATFTIADSCSVVLTALLLDAVVGINQRMMTPVQASIYLLLAIEVFDSVHRRASALRTATVIGLSASAVLISIPTIAQLADSRTTWKNLHDLQAIAIARSPLRNIPTDTFVFSDDPPAAWNSAGLTAYKLPLRVIATTAQPDRDYDEHVDQVVAITEANDSLVVVSDAMRPPTDIDAYLTRGLVVLARCPNLIFIGRAGSAHGTEVARGDCTAPNRP